MRLLLVLLLVLQLDPVVGAALCLQREHAASEECPMPETPASAERALAPFGTPAEAGCIIAQLCVPTSPAVTGLAQVFPLVPLLYAPPARLDASTGPEGVATPPFHPPRV